jgi:hypothetical protein
MLILGGKIYLLKIIRKKFIKDFYSIPAYHGMGKRPLGILIIFVVARRVQELDGQSYAGISHCVGA